MTLGRLAAALVLALVSGAGAEERAPTVLVTGEAEARVKPDEAVISLSTNVEKPTAEAAQEERVATAVVDGLKSAGVPAEDIRTTSLTLFPEYARTSSGSTGSITGYRAVESFDVRVCAMDKAGALEAAAVGNGALPMGAVRFEVSDREQRQDALRGAAIENARRRAELYARGAGMKVGALIAIVESGTTAPSPAPRTYAALAAPSAAPIESGLLTLRETVSVTYALTTP